MPPPQSPLGRRGLGLHALLALCAALEGCSAPPLAREADLSPERPAPLEVRSRLAFGDVVRVQVYLHPELSTGELGRRVDYEGNLDLPLIGPLAVVGRTVSEVRDALTAEAARYVRAPSVSVGVVEYAPRHFYVLGEVGQAGAFELDGPTTALLALARAGGLTRLADRKEVVVLRAAGERLTVHRFDAATPGPDGLYPIEPGDLLFARESGAGTFQQQIMPYLQGLSPPFAAAASLFLVAESAGD